jgi:hypothetical protein
VAVAAEDAAVAVAAAAGTAARKDARRDAMFRPRQAAASRSIAAPAKNAMNSATAKLVSTAMVGSTAPATSCSTSPFAPPTMPTASRQGNATKRDSRDAAVAVGAAVVEAAARATASRVKRSIRPRRRPTASGTTASRPAVRLAPTTPATKSHSPPATA